MADYGRGVLQPNETACRVRPTVLPFLETEAVHCETPTPNRVDAASRTSGQSNEDVWKTSLCSTCTSRQRLQINADQIWRNALRACAFEVPAQTQSKCHNGGTDVLERCHGGLCGEIDHKRSRRSGWNK